MRGSSQRQGYNCPLAETTYRLVPQTKGCWWQAQMMVQGTGRNRVYRGGCKILAWAQSVGLEFVPAGEYRLADGGRKPGWCQRSWDAQRGKKSPHNSPPSSATTQWEREGAKCGLVFWSPQAIGWVHSTGKSCRRPGQGPHR